MTPQNHLIMLFQEAFPESNTDFCSAINCTSVSYWVELRALKIYSRSMSGKPCVAGKVDISFRITSQLPSHKAKQESLHLQGSPQSQLCVINMLKHMADRSNAWRFEILNSLCKTWASFKFLRRGDRVGTALRACGAGGLVNSSLHCAGQREIPTQAQLEPQCARAQSSHSDWEPFSPLHICRQRSQSLPQLNKQFKNFLLGP